MMHDVLLAEHDAALGHEVLRSLAKVCIHADWVRSAVELRTWLARTRERGPALIRLDWELPGAPPGEALALVEGHLPASRVVVLGERLTGDTAAVLLSRGVSSIHKPVHPFVLSMLALDLASDAQAPAADATDAAAFGVAPQPQPQSRPQSQPPSRHQPPSPSFDNLFAAYAASRRLSKQQALILDLYLNGKSDKEIAELCACSGATVYEHWRRMAKKSGGRQKSDLIADFHRYLRQTPAPSSRPWPLTARTASEPTLEAPPLTGTYT